MECNNAVKHVAVMFLLISMLATYADANPNQPSLMKGIVQAPGEAVQTQVWEAYSKIPLSFEANLGQTTSQVKFLARGSGYTLFLTASEAVLSLRGAMPGEDREWSSGPLHERWTMFPAPLWPRRGQAE
jgi:hypothetical protein